MYLFIIEEKILIIKIVGLILIITGALLSQDFLGDNLRREWQTRLLEWLKHVKEKYPKIIPTSLTAIPGKYRALLYVASVGWLDAAGIGVSITSLVVFIIFLALSSLSNYLNFMIDLILVVLIIGSIYMFLTLGMQIAGYLMEGLITFAGGMIRGVLLFTIAINKTSLWLTTILHERLSSFLEFDKSRNIIGMIGIVLTIVGTILTI
jgi:hypothetical protein